MQTRWEFDKDTLHLTLLSWVDTVNTILNDTKWHIKIIMQILTSDQNHRMPEVRKDLWRLFGPTPA